VNWINDTDIHAINATKHIYSYLPVTVKMARATKAHSTSWFILVSNRVFLQESPGVYTVSVRRVRNLYIFVSTGSKVTTTNKRHPTNETIVWSYKTWWGVCNSRLKVIYLHNKKAAVVFARHSTNGRRERHRLVQIWA